MEIGPLKILVTDYVMMGRDFTPSNPKSIDRFPLFEGIFEVSNIVFIGSNIFARPPTCLFI